MVCMDGFILTHAYERVDLPTQEEVDAFLPSYDPVQVLDPADPYSIGAMVGPDAFTEVRYLAHDKQLQALTRIPEIGAVFKEVFGRESGGLIHPYRTEGAETILVALGSVNGTIKDVVDAMREAGEPVGSVGICSFRPFPLQELREALIGAERVVVIEKCLAPGLGGVLASNVRMAMQNAQVPVHTVIAGLGGRPITMASIERVITQASGGTLPDVHMLDLNQKVVETEIARAKETRKSGPAAENILKQLAAARPDEMRGAAS